MDGRSAFAMLGGDDVGKGRVATASSFSYYLLTKRILPLSTNKKKKMAPTRLQTCCRESRVGVRTV